MPNEMLDHAREKIDVEILVLQERIRSLRSSRNTLALIHRLPLEVMARIFMEFQRLHRYHRNQNDYASFPKWIQVTHVSQHWRDIALSSKTLYSTILTRNPAYSKEMLKHSGLTALSLIDNMDYMDYVATGKSPNYEIEDAIVPVLPRVRTLSLGYYSAKCLLPLLERPDLTIEDLCVRSWKSLTRSMFPGSLRFLRLEHCRFDSYEWLYGLSNLLELTIIPSQHDTDSQVSEDRGVAVGMLLDILDAMPQLVSLTISSKHTSATTPINRVSPITPKLQHLKLTADMDYLVQCFPWLTFAPRFTIEIFTKVKEYSTNWLPFFEKVNQELRSSSMALCTAGITCSDDNDTSIKFAEATDHWIWF